MNKVLVTGANGFIGKYVSEEIRKRGLILLPFDGDIFTTNFDHYMQENRPDYLINLAWITGDGYSESPHNLLFVQKGIEMYLAFYRYGGKRAIYIGTEQEYARTGKILTEGSAIAPTSLYAKCKADLADMLVKASLNEKHGFVWGRLFFVYGAGEKSRRLMPSIINGLAAGETVLCSHDSFVRDYIYVKDLAGAICHCLLSEYTGVVNLAGGRDTTIGEIANIAHMLIGKGKVAFRSINECEEQPAYVRGDISLLEHIGWQNSYTLEMGLKEEIAFLMGTANE